MFGDFVARTLSEPFRWGQTDCALWCGAAVLAATGYDPAADLRGTYASRFECYQIVKRAGGLVNLIAPRMDRFAPLSGDGVAVARLDGVQICGLIMGGRLVVRKVSGLYVADDFAVVRGWSW